MRTESGHIDPPTNGIGWTPDRFRLEIWTPNCGLNRRPLEPAGVHTWEQATEIARRFIADHGDPVLSMTFVTVDPLGDGTP